MTLRPADTPRLEPREEAGVPFLGQGKRGCVPEAPAAFSSATT